MTQSKDKQPADDRSPLAPVPPGDREPKLDPPDHEKTAQPSLTLPRGALITLRKSGGLKFSTQEIVVYPDGRVTYGGGDTSKTPQTRPLRKLNDAQIMRLRRTLDASGFFRLRSEKRDQPPDSFAYEIVARLGSRSNSLEFFTGSVPQSLEPLIQQLTQLM